MFKSVEQENRAMIRLLNKVTPNPKTGCWEFTGYKSAKGYGYIGVAASESRHAHRVSYHIFKGAIPEDLFVLHKCDVPCCVNPEHLWAGTNAENMADMVRKGRSNSRNRTHCKNGHEFTEENTARRWDNGHRDCRKCRNAIRRQNYYRSHEKQKEANRLRYHKNKVTACP